MLNNWATGSAVSSLNNISGSVCQYWTQRIRLSPVYSLRQKMKNKEFCEAGLFICCKGNKNLDKCKVSWLKTPWLSRFKENYVTRKVSGLSRNGRQACWICKFGAITTRPRYLQKIVCSKQWKPNEHGFCNNERPLFHNNQLHELTS